MATNKTINPTNVTVQIPAMADKPNQATTSNCIDKAIDGINAVNGKVPVLLFNNNEGATGLNVDFSKYGAFIIGLPDNMTTVVTMVGSANAEFNSVASIYGSAANPVVIKSYRWKINSTGTGFYIDTSKSYQINFSSSAVPSLIQITNNKFYKVWGIPI